MILTIMYCLICKSQSSFAALFILCVILSSPFIILRTATIDVIGTGLLVLSFSWLTDAGLANMATDTTTLSNNL